MLRAHLPFQRDSSRFRVSVGVPCTFDCISWSHRLPYYRAIAVATRVNNLWRTGLGRPDLAPISHSILLATVPGHEEPFLVDVALWGTHRLSMVSKPIPLVPGVVTYTPPEEYRLVQGDNVDSSLEEASRGWWLQARDTPAAPWRAILYFTLEEYTDRDFEYPIYSMAKMPDGLGHRKLYSSKIVEGPTGELERYAIVGNVATKQIGCQEKVVIEKFRWEHERIDAIRRLCGIQLDAADALKHMQKREISLPIQKQSRL